MDPIMINLGIVNITWYAFFMTSAFAIGIAIALKELTVLKYEDITKELILDYVFYVILFGIIGARTWYVLFDGDFYLDTPLQLIAIWNGGLAIHGAIVAGIIVTAFYSKKKNINPFKLLDLAVPAMLIGQSIGRFGNFVNQEAHGGATTYEFLHDTLHLPEFIVQGMYIDGVYYQPTFLYESIWNLVGFLIVIFILRPKWRFKVGMLSGFYLMWYGFIRIFIEMMRTDALMFGPIKVAQLASVIMFISGIILMVYLTKKEKNEQNRN
jgi:phosphatidylglycerol:prolipoprotein diacylglycerol transferase